jgi:predicted nucleotidyltransferase
MATGRSELLGALAERVASALPAKIVEEVVLTGSVSRGVADEVSDIEMLVITGELLELDECFELARGAGLEELDTWGAREGPARRVFGYRETVPMEMVWWSRDYAEAQVGAALAGEASSIADALAYGLPLRTTGLLERWQAWLSEYPPELAAARIEDAALPWSGFAPAGVLTLIRPDDRLVLAEWLVDAAKRV